MDGRAVAVDYRCRRTDVHEHSGCRTAIFIADENGTIWPLNGTARSHGVQWGAQPSIDPIWRADRADPQIPGARINIGPLTTRALAIC